MICAGHGRTLLGQNRAEVAARRASVARAMLKECHFCMHHCGVDRLAGPAGRCHAASEAHFFSAQSEVTDELELIPAFNVALSGCDLRCDFCITGGPSWSARSGEPFDPLVMGTKARRALQNGARCIMILGGEPTIHLPSVLEFVAELPGWARLVWKTNAHGSAQARELLEGMFDIWIADFKFGNDTCAQRLAKLHDYVRGVRENLAWAYKHSKLIVRHLLMPQHLECCWKPIAEWLAMELPAVKVSLRTGYWPAWRAGKHVELTRPLSEDQAAAGISIAQSLRLNLIA
jgi:putative pyruvate formate lyase activating enzyme